MGLSGAATVALTLGLRVEGAMVMAAGAMVTAVAAVE